MNLGNRYSQKSFAQTPAVHMARSQFDRSFARKTTMKPNILTPIYCDEVIPGDTINLSLRTFSRMLPQVVPLMDNLWIKYYFFFVPNRLVWDNWERFCGSQDNPGDSISYICPYRVVPINGAVNGGLFDYFGLPTNDTGQVNPAAAAYTINNVMPLRGYLKIFNDWFRDENITIRATLSTADGPDTTSQFNPQLKSKVHDYFTSSLPWPQKGGAVTLPLGISAPVIGTTTGIGMTDGTTNFGIVPSTSIGIDSRTASYGGTVGVVASAGGITTNKNIGLTTDPTKSGMIADLSTATAATINQLRQAMMVQSLLELDARGGTRYVEILLAHYGVTSPDFRLQRPEYLGGGRDFIQANAVPQTAPTSGSNYQGQLAAFSVAKTNDNSIGFSKSFVEHGYVIGMACLEGDITYQQGMERMWNRKTRYDFFWPKLQQMGEQAIQNKEIYCQGDASGQDDLTFAYQERYAEYRYKPSQITGQFRSQYATSLDVWHLGQYYTSLPALNFLFISSNTPIARNMSVPANLNVALWDGWFDIKHARPMMANPVPATLGRF